MRRPTWLIALATSFFGCHSCSSSSSDGAANPVVSAAIDASAPAVDVALKSWPNVSGEGTDIGTSEPTRKAFADSQRRWVLVCQGPDDATATWRFVLGAGKGKRVDGLLAIAPKGEFLVLAVDGVTMFVDVAKGVASRIVDEPTVAGFSKDGTKLVYVDHHDVVRLDLASRVSNRVALPDGVPYLVDVDTSGSWTMISMGRTVGENWYGPPDDLSCAQPDPYVINFVRRGVPVWVDLATGKQTVDRQVVRVAGGHTYRVEKDALTIDGVATGPKDCDADTTISGGIVTAEALQVLGVVESPPRALVLCVRTKGAKTVEVVAPEKTLGATKAALMFNGVNNVAPMIVPNANRVCDQYDTIVPTCLDVTSGAKGKETSEPEEEAFGMHAGKWWYAASGDGYVLAGPNQTGPLAWMPRPK